jgi:integrase/recombinase XerD
MLEGGADIRYVSEMLGHAKLETTALYTRVSIAKLRAVHAATHPAGNDITEADIRLLRAVPGGQPTS